MRRLALAVALAVLGLSAPASAVLVVTTPSNELVEFFATPYTVTTVGGPLTIVNTDTVPHSILSEAIRPDGSAPWCDLYDSGQCPLFSSVEVARDISPGAAQVRGLNDVTGGGTIYPFYCGVHHWMKGTLLVV